MNVQLVTPNVGTQDSAGFCLRFTQTVWGAPVRHATAWDAWEATEVKHSPAENIPGEVGVLAWFDHWGTYGGQYGQYGHVVSWIPGKGYLSSPTNGYGQKWLGSIEEVERAYNCTYVGWSEDINGLRVAVVNTPQPKPVNNKKEDTKMMLAHKPQPDGSLLFLLFGDNFYLEFSGQDAANAFAGQIGSASAPVSQSFFDKVKAEVEAGRR